VRILGIETSCDETAAAVVEDGQRLRSNVIASQVEEHARYGGIVPEVASRQHLLALDTVVRRALEEAETSLQELDAVAVTHGPGLAGALLVGVNYAKGLAQGLEVPLVGVNHLEGHVYAAWLTETRPEETPGFPLLCLIASGGHSDLVLMHGHGRFQLLGRTRDDAAGEAFDKAARVLGLGFPGGPAIQRAAQDVPAKDQLPRAWLRGSHDFSFSGLKTALLHLAQARGLYPPSDGASPQAIREVASAFQEAVADVLTQKTVDAAGACGARGVVLVGGVAANALLRQRMVQRTSLPVLIPPIVLCTDNGAMIAACACFLLQQGRSGGISLDVLPALGLGSAVSSQH